MNKSDYRVLAIDEKTGCVIGFVTAITDHVLCAYIPLLEVLPSYQKLAIGKELITQMLDQLQEYYESFNMSRVNGMLIRNYLKQSSK